MTSTDHLTHDHNFLSGAHDENARRTLWVVGLTMVAGLCGVFLAFFGEALSRLSGTVISEPWTGSIAGV